MLITEIIVLSLLYLIIGFFVTRWAVFALEEIDETTLVGSQILSFILGVVIWPITVAATTLFVIIIKLDRIKITMKKWNKYL